MMSEFPKILGIGINTVIIRKEFLFTQSILGYLVFYLKVGIRIFI